MKLLLAAFFLVSFTLDGIWYAGAGSTIRDLSKSLGEDGRPGQYITGQWAYEFCLENRRMPILCNWHGGGMNKRFADHNDDLTFTVFVLDSLAEQRREGDEFQCDIERFPPRASNTSKRSNSVLLSSRQRCIGCGDSFMRSVPCINRTMMENPCLTRNC